MTIQIELHLQQATLQDEVSPSELSVDFSAETFSETIKRGRFVGWVMAEDIFLEDHGFEEYEGDDVYFEDVEVVSVDASTQSLSLRARFDFELADGSPEDKEGYIELFNALSSAVMLLYWTGEGESKHPDQGTGLYWFSGEFNRVLVNGTLIHER